MLQTAETGVHFVSTLYDRKLNTKAVHEISASVQIS